MKLAGEYTFDAPVKTVWEALLDPEVLAATLPGCDKLELIDGVYEGELNIKVGPVQGKFKGKVALEELRELEGYTMVVDGKGAPGFVKARADIVLTESGPETKISYDSDAKVGGRIASVGQRLLEASAKAIVKQSLDGLNEIMKQRAAGNSDPATIQAPSQSEFARKVASEVTKELIPTPVRYGLVVAAMTAIALLVYSLAT
ncbi:MAG: carbon monoxide dehydrogenase subunit G [Myxococcota bacterium]